jgi:hypothetical protein
VKVEALLDDGLYFERAGEGEAVSAEDIEGAIIAPLRELG